MIYCLLSLIVELTENSIHEFTNLDCAITILIEFGKKSPDILFLEIKLKVSQSFLKLLILKAPISIEIVCLEKLLETKESSLTSLCALLSNSLKVVLKVLWLLDFWHLFNFIHLLAVIT